MTELNYFKQRVPGFIDPRGLVRADFEFTETQELLDHPYIQNWMKDGGSAMKKNNMIIVKTGSGSHFVVGFVKNPDDVNLPVMKEND